jgi:hypothetical protein
VYEREGNIAAAIADRTAVLSLGETMYDRRYIALGRRARALRKLGDQEGADRDIEAILATPDIAVEQKMEARLQRAEWRIASDTPEAAMPDLAAVVASARNFDGIEERALALLESLEGSGAEAK